MIKRNLFFLFSLTTFAAASLILSVYNYNPYEAGRNAFLNFYLAWLFSSTGILAVAIYYVKIHYLKENTRSSFWPSLRQGFFAGLTMTILLFLRGVKLLDWWVGTSAVIVIVLLELFFQTKRSTPKS